jgi:hypothetical protein
VSDRDRHFELATVAHGIVKVDLGLTGWRENLVRQRGKTKALSPADLADALAAASMEALGDAVFEGEDRVQALRALKLELTDEERRAFATAFLDFNDHMLSRAETRSLGSVEGVKQHTVEFVPRTDVTWAENPIERLHQAWSLHEEELEKSIGVLDWPFKALDEMDATLRGLDPMAQFGFGRHRDVLGAIGRFSEPLGLSKLGFETTDSAEKLRRQLDSLHSVVPKHLGVDDAFRAATMSKLARLDKAVGVDDLDRISGPMAKMLRDDRDQWKHLRSIESVMPQFAMAASLGEGAFAAVADSLRVQRHALGPLYEAFVHRPTRAFASYLEDTDLMAKTASARVRSLLDAAVERGAQHHLSASQAAARILAIPGVDLTSEEGVEMPQGPFGLLASVRDELVRRGVADPESPVDDVVKAAPLGKVLDLVRQVLELITQCNDAAHLRGLGDIFKPTTRGYLAILQLPFVLPTDKSSFGDVVDHLYMLMYEGAGSENLRFEIGKGAAGVFLRTESEFDAVMDLKFLRTKWLRHDAEHGGKGAAVTFRDLEGTLSNLGRTALPRSTEDFQSTYSQLLARLHGFLLKLRARLEAIPPRS